MRRTLDGNAIATQKMTLPKKLKHKGCLHDRYDRNSDFCLDQMAKPLFLASFN